MSFESDGSCMRIGSHIRTGGGLAVAAAYAASVGCETIQIFSKSPLNWRSRLHDEDEAASFRTALSKHGITLAATHGAYLTNLASADRDLWERSIDALVDEMRRAEHLTAPAVVTHLGSAPDRRADACRRAAEAVTRALVRTEGISAGIYLENSAASGSTIGGSTDELLAVLKAIPTSLRHRTAICIDTCHAHASGHDLKTRTGWRRLLGPIEQEGVRVPLVHANDAKFGCGSHRDRHAWIGEGTIGYEGFSLMFEQEVMQGSDVITEMPGEAPDKDVINVARLKALRDL